MKFLMIHNDYGAPSGEEIQFYHIRKLLEDNGHETKVFTRSSEEIPAMLFGKLRAFGAGVYNPWSRKRVAKLIEEFKPDAVLVKNLYPFISPAILPVIRRAGVPIVMFVANYRLMCPNGLHMNKGQVCEKCLGGREYNCVLNNCEGNLFKSAGYALRNTVARVAGWYQDNVGAYVCASHFLRRRLIEAGFDEKKIHLSPNVVPEVLVHPANGVSTKPYVGYVGRISREKGVHTIIDAARRCPEIPFRIVGRVNDDYHLVKDLPPNVQMVGFLAGEDLSRFYAGARMTISASECFESFGMSVAEAMQHGRPVVVSRIGVFPEFVQDGVTGRLFEPGDAEGLAARVRELWANPERCEQMGRAGRAWARREYSPEMYYSRLMNVIRSIVPSATERAKSEAKAAVVGSAAPAA